MKGLAEFMTTEKVNLGLDDYNDEDFEDGFEETQPQTLSQVDLPKFRVEGDEIELLEPPKLDEALAFEPQSFVEFEVIYEDPSIIVVNKPAGLVVHPGAGNPDGTLLNGLLYHFPELKDVPRAGIVHRLDRDHRPHGGGAHARRADESGPPASGTHGQA